MLGRAQKAKASPRTVGKKVAAKPAFTMQRLWQLSMWGTTAAVALLVATFTSRSEVGAQRVATVLSSLHLGSSSLPRPGQTGPQVASQAPSEAPIHAPARAFDAESASRQLAQAVRGLAEDRDRLTARLASIEHNMEDITGSITRQIEAVKTAAAEKPAPWPTDKPPVPVTTSANIVSVVQPVVPAPADMRSPLPASPLTADATPPPPPGTASPSPTYGIDIGSALSIQTLQARWAGTRSAHPQLFEGLTPVVTLKDIPRSKRVELRLVVGPLPSAGAAAQLCASLAAFRLFCQPTTFDGQHLALQ